MGTAHSGWPLRPDHQSTIGELFERAVARHADRPLIMVPSGSARDYHPDGCTITYGEARSRVGTLVERYRTAGYGPGSRVALMVGNRPECFLHKLALNSIGACVIPLNADLMPAELDYILGNSAPDLAIGLPTNITLLGKALAGKSRKTAVAVLDDIDGACPRNSSPIRSDSNGIQSDTAATILYTSGTTGRPKGCVLSHYYELVSGYWYASRGGMAAAGDGTDRIYNALPLYHVNALIFSFYGALLSGNAQVQTDRFRPDRWWSEIKETNATIVHYLGVIVSMLLNQPESPADRDHVVRFGVGAGVEPTLQQAFEERYGFPLVEVWGMTEVLTGPWNNVEPRHVGTRAFGRPPEGLEVKVVDDEGAPVDPGTPGELLVRHSEEAPRLQFFSGYLDDPEATEKAWAGGWFHTGDVVLQSSEGMLHFVERKKNIIRRAGENIAAGEVEAVILSHPGVRQVAVIAVEDELREEEVFACVIWKDDSAGLAQTQEIFEYCQSRLAYFKLPGWFLFVDQLPTTDTQKLLKHKIFPEGTDPRGVAGALDFRDQKRRKSITA